MSVAIAIEAQPRRAVGRPSKTATFRTLTAEMLTREPVISSQAVLKAARAGGYEGAQSAFYDMVADVRRVVGVKAPRERVGELVAQAAEKRIEEGRRRAQRRKERVQWEAKEGERIAQRTRERVEAKEQAQREREDRRTNWQRLQVHPTAAHEQSCRLRVIARRWFASRDATHKANGNERSRWTGHLAPFFGDLEPAEVDVAKIRAFVEDRLATGLNSTTVGHLVATFSSLFSDLVDEGVVARNPVKSVPRAVKRLYRKSHDPRTTPFLETMEDIRRLRASLTEPMRTLFTVAVMSGLRPGELVALDWGDFRSDLRLLHVQRRYRDGKVDVPKSGKGRTLAVAPELSEILRQQRLTDSAGLVFKPFGRSSHLNLQLWRLRNEWRAGLKRAGLPYIKFYHATRHTFASQWVMAGHSIEKLSKILGHSSIVVTEVYAHLKPESFNVPDVISFGPRVADPLVLEARAA